MSANSSKTFSAVKITNELDVDAGVAYFNMVAATDLMSTDTVSFFGADSASQQAGPTLLNDTTDDEVNIDSFNDATVSLMNSLNTYGLINNAPINTGRKITFINNTTNSPTLQLYVTLGGKGNSPTLYQTFAGTGTANAIEYNIPDEYHRSLNFQVWPVGLAPTNFLGSDLVEFIVNSPAKPFTTETNLDYWDISTVPPSLPASLDCGPRAQAVATSYMKITNPGSGYNPGYKLSTVNNGTGLVTSVALTTPGTGYTDGDVLHVSGGHGTGLRVIVNTDFPPSQTGPVTQVKTVAPIPLGYRTGDVVTIDGGNNDATITLTVNESGTGSGMLVDLLSVSPSTNGSIVYPRCDPTWKPSTPGIGGFTIRDFGANYDENDRITVVQDTAITLTDGDTGYSVGDGITTTGGTGTSFTVDILRVTSTGKIVELAVNTVTGSYTVGDTLTVTGGSATFDIVSLTSAVDGEFTIGELSEDQVKSYNVGYRVTPPAPPDGATPLTSNSDFWPPVVTTCATLDGNSPQAITWPNDTALPKSQTGYSSGDYTVEIIDPTLVVII